MCICKNFHASPRSRNTALHKHEPKRFIFLCKSHGSIRNTRVICRHAHDSAHGVWERHCRRVFSEQTASMTFVGSGCELPEHNGTGDVVIEPFMSGYARYENQTVVTQTRRFTTFIAVPMTF